MEAIKYNINNNNIENLLEVLKDNSIISITDTLGRIEYANYKYAKVYDCESAILIGETHSLLKSHLHKGRNYRNLWRTIKMGHKWQGVLSDVSKKGNKFWLDTTVIPITDSEQNSTKYLSIYHDVTSLYEENKRLNIINEHNTHLLISMPIYVFSISRHGKILNANKTFKKVSVDELIGTYVYDYITPNCFEILKQNIDSVFKEKQTNQFELFEIDVNGFKIFYKSIIAPVFNELGGVVSATISMYEIENSREDNEQLLDSEAKYRSIYKSINVGIIVVSDQKGNIIEWNKGAELAFGYDSEEILGRPLTVLMSSKYKSSNIKQLIKAVNTINSNKNANNIEMSCLTKNGKEFPVEFALSRWFTNGNEYYCAMMLDISKRKTLENKLKQKSKDLELFLYRSAHDLKAPFSSSQGLINLLKEEKLNKRIRFLTEMLEETIKSGDIISENLSKASIILTKKKEFKKIDFNSIIKNVLNVLSGSANFDKIKFNTYILEPNTFKSDEELIKSLFQNLIQNAIKYSIEPSELTKPQIDIVVETNQKEIIIKISDNGLGIEEKKLNKIFDLYYRANSENIPGFGLGLYIVKNIVDELNGQINVLSEINVGTCFEILLPNEN